MAQSKKDQAKKHLPARHTRRALSGFWIRQKSRTDKNILKRLDKHVGQHPSDKVAKDARLKRLLNQ